MLTYILKDLYIMEIDHSLWLYTFSELFHKISIKENGQNVSKEISKVNNRLDIDMLNYCQCISTNKLLDQVNSNGLFLLLNLVENLFVVTCDGN